MSDQLRRLTTWFDPTDAMIVPAGEKIIDLLGRRGYATLLTHSELFRCFLSFNQLTLRDLLIPQKQEKILFCHHRSHYLQINWVQPLMHTHRSRSLEHLLVKTLRFQGTLEDTLLRMESQTSPPQCLEIGIGSGRALLELRTRVPNAVLTGISKEYGDEGFQGLDSIEKCSRLFELETEFRNGQGIELYYQDLTEGDLSLPDKQFDLILCQRTSRYIRRKDRLIERIYSHLKIGGEAYLEIQLLSLADFTGRKIDLQTFFHQERFSNIFQFVPEFHILKIHRKDSSEINLGLTPEPSKSYWTPWIEGRQEPVGWYCTMTEILP